MTLWASFSNGGYWHLGANAQVNYTDTDSLQYLGAKVAKGKTSSNTVELFFAGSKDKDGKDLKDTGGNNIFDKKGSKAFIVYVNNFDVVTPQPDPPKYTHLDNAINGPADKKRLSKLVLKKIFGLLPGDKVTIQVNDNVKIRIFDDTDTGRIGPPLVDGDGGPEKNVYVIPTTGAAGIHKSDLTYLVECVNHGSVVIQLLWYRDPAGLIASDHVYASMVVDRIPIKEKQDESQTSSPARFRVRGNVDLDGIDGIEARFDTPTQPKPNYNTTLDWRTKAYSCLWVSAQTTGNKFWIQTGLYVKVHDDEEKRQGVFIEVMDDGKHYRIEEPIKPIDWPKKGVYKIAVADDGKGTVNATLDKLDDNGPKLPADEFTKEFLVFKDQKLTNYQIGSELFHSNDQNFGTAAKPCVISDASVYVNFQQKNTAFDLTNVLIRDRNTRGIYIDKKMTESNEWDFSDVVPRGFKMWDKVLEY